MKLKNKQRNPIRLCAFILSGSMALFCANNYANDDDYPPRASVEEAKIKYWSMPEIEKDFWDITELENAYIDPTPVSLNDDIPVGVLGQDGGNTKLIVKLAKEIANGDHGKVDSLLIAQSGKLLFESYYLRGRVDLPHPQSSATKAYISMALGRAIQLGYLTMDDLHKPLIDFLPEINKDKLVSGAEKVTLHKAMHMHSGIRLTDEQKQLYRDNPSTYRGQKLVQAYLEHSLPITEASQTFLYQSDPMLVMQVIEAVVPSSAEDFLKKELLGKLGIANYGWETHDITGLPGSSSMTSRAMMKIGTLTKNKGKWKGEQIIPEDFIEKATSMIFYTGDDDIFGGGKDVSNQGYGYYWWGTHLHHEGKRYPSISAQGGGGIYLVLIEELDLMIVVTAHHRNESTQQLIAERIIPAFVNKPAQTL